MIHQNFKLGSLGGPYAGCCDNSSSPGVCAPMTPCVVDTRDGFYNCSYAFSDGGSLAFNDTTGLYKLTEASKITVCDVVVSVAVADIPLSLYAAVPGTPFCGDGYCDVASQFAGQINETCVSCREDCGPCYDELVQDQEPTQLQQCNAPGGGRAA